MAYRVHSATQVRDAAGDPSRRLVVYNDDRLERVIWVRRETAFQLRGGCTPAPISRHVVDAKAQSFCDSLPDAGEMTRFEDQDAIARRQCVDECRLGRP